MFLEDLRLVIFDLDGTLIDSAPDIQTALNILLTENNLAPYDLKDVKAMTGNGLEKLVARAVEGRSLAAPDLKALSVRMSDIYAASAFDKTRAYDGADHLLKMCLYKKVPIALCTNKPYAIAQKILKSLQWDILFSGVMGGDSLYGRKPDPAPLRAILDIMKFTPAQTVMVGDTAADAHAAQALNLPCILSAHGYSQTPVTELPATAYAEDLSGVQELLFGKDK